MGWEVFLARYTGSGARGGGQNMPQVLTPGLNFKYKEMAPDKNYGRESVLRQPIFIKALDC